MSLLKKNALLKQLCEFGLNPLEWALFQGQNPNEWQLIHRQDEHFKLNGVIDPATWRWKALGLNTNFFN